MRSLWKGSLSFGLVNIPVRLYTGSQEKELSFKMLHKSDLGLIRYARICKEDGKEVPWGDIVKGYEYQKGDYVVLTDEDFKKAFPKKMETIDIINFVDEKQIDTVFYDKPYFLEPDKGAGKVYALLREALKKSKKVALASYVMHNHEHIGVIKFYKSALVLNQLRYNTEVVDPAELQIPTDTKISTAEVSMALKLIEQLTGKFNPEKFHDSYVDKMMDVIERKAKGKKFIHHEKEISSPKASKVHDIMSLLKASLEQPPKKKRKIVA